MIDRNSAEFVEALARGLAVLEAFDAADPEMTLADLARKLELPIATVRRSILTLEALGFIRKHNKHFLLAPRVLALSSSYLNAFSIEEVVMPELQRLTSIFGDAANLAVLDGPNTLYVAHISESRGVRRTASFGVSYPAFATSMGRVMLSALSEQKLSEYFQNFTPSKFTEHTVTDEATLRNILTKVQANGFSVTVDQLDYGISAIAVPVKDRLGRTLCSINSSGYTPKLPVSDLIEKRLPELQTAANRLSLIIARIPALMHSLQSNPHQA